MTSGMSYIHIVLGQSELGAAASRKAVWWDLRLASYLTHLLLLLLLLLSLLLLYYYCNVGGIGEWHMIPTVSFKCA